MFNTNFFGLSSTDSWRDMDKLSLNDTFVISLFLSKICLSWQTNLLLVLDSDHNEDWVCVISSQDVVDFDVIKLDIWASRVPTDDLFAWVDFSHHVKHLLVVDVIEEPDVWLILVFFEWDCETIGDFQYTIISIFAHECSDDSLLGVFETFKESIVMIDYTQKHSWMNDNNIAFSAVDLVD